MEDNSLLMIVLAFVIGYMCSGMIKQMCGRRLVEGDKMTWDIVEGGTVVREEDCNTGVPLHIEDNLDLSCMKQVSKNTYNTIWAKTCGYYNKSYPWDYDKINDTGQYTCTAP